jgi:hypothetical protein
VAQPLLERDLLCHADRPDILADTDGPGIEILFDLREHKVVGTCGNGRVASFALGPTTVAAFHADFVKLITELGGTPTFNDTPNEVPNPVPFAEDHRDRPYDRDAVQRFHQALVAIDRVFRFRTSFLGKSSPVHLFWGALDLAVTRFSGRRAPLHPAGIPPCPTTWRRRPMTARCPRQASGRAETASTIPPSTPTPIRRRRLSGRAGPARCRVLARGLSEFVLPYDAVQSAADPDEA